MSEKSPTPAPRSRSQPPLQTNEKIDESTLPAEAAEPVAPVEPPSVRETVAQLSSALAEALKRIDPKEEPAPEEAPKPPTVPESLAKVADELSGALLKFEALADQLRGNVDFDTTPIEFRRHRAHDCGVVFRLELYKGGERVTHSEGTIPMLQLMAPKQMRDAWTKFNTLLDALVVSPFLGEVFSELQESVNQTVELDSPHQLQNSEQRDLAES